MATIEEQLAKIEGQLASSWALKARSEYEVEVKEHIKNEILAYTTKLAIAALIMLSGAGYLFIKSAVHEVYATENQKVISDLNAKYENNLADERARFEWKRYHDYGKNYIYLAEFYWNSTAGDKNKNKALIAKQFSNANTYLLYAMRADPQQATTYWELGELHYSYAKQYEQPDWVDNNKALHFYQQAAKFYTETEISRGWRADAYRLIGKIYSSQAGGTSNGDEVKKSRETSLKYLSMAREDYANVIPESREYNKDRLTEVDTLLVKFPKSIEINK